MTRKHQTMNNEEYVININVEKGYYKYCSMPFT